MPRMMLLICFVSGGLFYSATADATTTLRTETPKSSHQRPNILYIMSDDHASHAISAYGSVINKTPQIDRLAREGMRLKNCFVTNSICGPSRATILTGKYSHRNGFYTHSSPPFDGSQMTFPKLFQKAGYQTAVVGKWHLKSEPTGFDYHNVLIGQGYYHNPRFIDMGTTRTIRGYSTDIITDLSIEWLKNRDQDRPFLLLCQHKAPHRPWQPAERHMKLYEDEEIPQPPTFDDIYAHRASPAEHAEMRIEDDLTLTDVKTTPPVDLKGAELKNWYYQRYIKEYLRCVAAVDENVGRLLDYIEEEGLLNNTIVIYTSDQGFFLGDHGWYDKRFMYEESLRMPFLVRYPKEIPAGSESEKMVINADFAPTLLDYAGIPTPDDMQGQSFRKVLQEAEEPDWRKSMDYHYFEYPDVDHMVARHYGVRTDQYKLIHYYFPTDEWELFDLQKDPLEMRSVYNSPDYATTVADLKQQLQQHRERLGDTDPDMRRKK